MIITGHRYDLKDERYGRWTVVDKSNTKPYSWNCVCDCGTKAVIPAGRLRDGRHKKCRSCQGNLRTGPNSPFWKGCGEISKSFYGHVRGTAKRRRLYFDLTIKEISDLFEQQNRACALSGLPLSFEHKYRKKSNTTASLDRIDSRKGYTLDNVQWVHKDVNLMKMNLSEDRLIELCVSIAGKKELRHGV